MFQTLKRLSNTNVKFKGVRVFKICVLPNVKNKQDNKIIPMEKEECVKRLKESMSMSKMNHEEHLLTKPTLKDAHVYCVIYGLSAQQYGILLEKYIISKYGFIKNMASDCTGDCSKNGDNIEVKASLGGAQHNRFNFVQIRISQNIQTYLFTAYHLNQENVEMEGELYIFRIPKVDMKRLIVNHGGYAHGTVKEHGEIKIESMDDEQNRKEYALRPRMEDKCWKDLLPFRIVDIGIE